MTKHLLSCMLVLVCGCGDGVTFGTNLVTDEMFIQEEYMQCGDEQPAEMEVGESPIFVMVQIQKDFTYDFNPSYASVKDGVLYVDCSKNKDDRSDGRPYSTNVYVFIGVGQKYRPSGIVGHSSSGLVIEEVYCEEPGSWFQEKIEGETGEVDEDVLVNYQEIPNGDYLFLSGLEGTLTSGEWASYWLNSEGIKVEDGHFYMSTETPESEYVQNTYAYCEGKALYIHQPYPEDDDVWDGE